MWQIWLFSVLHLGMMIAFIYPVGMEFSLHDLLYIQVGFLNDEGPKGFKARLEMLRHMPGKFLGYLFSCVVISGEGKGGWILFKIC